MENVYCELDERCEKDPKTAEGKTIYPTVKISVDCSDLDLAIEEANRLVELLREASSIINSLSVGIV